MNNIEIRKKFLDFFRKNLHICAEPSQIVNKNDPTLMFTNAGMNQFKDIFLGNQNIKEKRLVNSQLCLRVSGKHNDIEEVGIDTYHHTLFEMLGNWSMNDYFKEEAIKFAWKLLTEEYKIDKSNLYVTVFEGSNDDNNLEKDIEAYNIWKNFVNEDHIVLGNKHDNFWEMGEIGPCGPCSEIHIDLRDEHKKKKILGRDLVNASNPEVIEIWNIVFIQYERLQNGQLRKLDKHFIDTGMGFERLTMVLQNKKSVYDTDIFMPYIKKIEELSGIKYGVEDKKDIAFRVIADHIRAITMTIAEGLIPNNIKEGYVIRRILRRAVRYGYSFLNFDEPFLYKLANIVLKQFECFKLNIKIPPKDIENIILKEEESFFKTLKLGIKKLDNIISKSDVKDVISGKIVFELYDTYGFPVDLTKLILAEHNISFDEKEFKIALEEQKNRSKNVAKVTLDDWIFVNKDLESKFIGYDYYVCETKIIKYRKVVINENEFYHIVFENTPFYGESGGQVGDTGILVYDDKNIEIFDTKKEYGEILHCVKSIPNNLNVNYRLKIDVNRRNKIAANHSCTHILQASLKKLFDENIKQCGSKVDTEKLRFDFNYSKNFSDIDIKNLEKFVNNKIKEGLHLIEKRDVSINEAKKENVTAIFEDKYGDKVRIIEFENFSKEFCCGTHVKNTNTIKNFRIIKCKNIASGIKRIEATAELT